jgi:crotonobetainyl-CoA:carnitine CoA-transferase CaiB-like acyl-CoA transferase
VERLLAIADLAFVAFPPRVVDALGLDYGSLARVCRAPVVYLTNFGFEGPYRDYRLADTVLYAMGGEMYSHGLAAREPLKLGGTAALMQGGAMAAIAALGAIHAWELHAVGQRIDVNLFQAQANSVDRRSSAILAYRFSGRVQERAESNSAGVAGGVYPTADGFVEVTAASGSYWQRLVEMIDDDALRGPRWSDPAFLAAPAAREEAEAVIYPWMLSRTSAEVWEEARRTHAMVAPIWGGADLAGDPVLRERGYWETLEDPELGEVPMVCRPWLLEKTPWRLRRPAPAVGQDTETLLAELGFTPGAIGDLRAAGAVA